MSKRNVANGIYRDLSRFNTTTSNLKAMRYLLSAIDQTIAGVMHYKPSVDRSGLQRDRDKIKSWLTSPNYYKMLVHSDKSVQKQSDLGNIYTQLLDMRLNVVKIVVESGLDEYDAYNIEDDPDL